MISARETIKQVDITENEFRRWGGAILDWLVREGCAEEVVPHFEKATPEPLEG